MCTSSPNIPTPDPVQEAKQPDIAAVTAARKKSAQTQGGTLLTGPAGIDNAAVKTGSNTLLGG